MLFPVQADYDPPSACIVLKCLDDYGRLVIIRDATFRPFFYASSAPPDIRKLVEDHRGAVVAEERTHPMTREKVRVFKVVVPRPGLVEKLRGKFAARGARVWEAKVPFVFNYFFTRRIVPCAPHRHERGRLVPAFDLAEEAPGLPPALLSTQLHKELMLLFALPKPVVPVAALDVELVEGRLTHVGLRMASETLIITTEPVSGPGVLRVPDEKALLEAAFKKLDELPFVFTWNGDEFDFRILEEKARAYGLDCPIAAVVRGGSVEKRTLRKGVHVDLMKFYRNPAIKNYAFGGAYKHERLDEVARALLGKGKLAQELPGTPEERLEYLKRDLELTYGLAELALPLIISLARVVGIPVEELTRERGVGIMAYWALVRIHKQRGILVPSPGDMAEKMAKWAVSGAAVRPIIKDKLYRGGEVIPPKPGLHENVVVLDFASLYPTVVARRNISYETVLCPHPECRANRIPEVGHWVCTKWRGILAEFLGALRDLRVGHFKKLAKTEPDPRKRRFYDAIQRALKVLMNAAYGLMGDSDGPLFFLPAAETVTAYGRHALHALLEKAGELGLEAIYGDTDSVFLKSPPPEALEALREFAARELALDLDVDKEYRLIAFSSRKKNYYGVLADGRIDAKGLVGIKSSTPAAFRRVFSELAGMFSGLSTAGEAREAVEKALALFDRVVKDLHSGRIPPEELRIAETLGKNPSEYKQKTLALQAIRNAGAEDKFHRGDIVEYVLTKKGPVLLEAYGGEPIDAEAYEDRLITLFLQFLEPLGVTEQELRHRARAAKAGTKPKVQATLEAFFTT